MDASRVHLRPAIEWMLAAAFILGSFAVASIIFRQVRAATAVTPVIAHESTPGSSTERLPVRAVSVPLLVLTDGVEVRVGDSADQVAMRLGRLTLAGPETLEQTPLGDRLVRFYQHGATEFILVFDTVQGGIESSVLAIYIR
jgi:hypothetical protein